MAYERLFWHGAGFTGADLQNLMNEVRLPSFCHGAWCGCSVALRLEHTRSSA